MVLDEKKKGAREFVSAICVKQKYSKLLEHPDREGWRVFLGSLCWSQCQVVVSRVYLSEEMVGKLPQWKNKKAH